MWIVGQEWLAGDGVLPGDDPGVGADAWPFTPTGRREVVEDVERRELLVSRADEDDDELVVARRPG